MLSVFGRGKRIGLEIGHGVLRAATVDVKAGVRTVARLDSADLPEGAVLDSFTRPNIQDRASFVGALRKLAGRMGRGGVNVALPDSVARVVILDFESLPKKADEVARMIKWRLKKLMPFDVEEASLRYQYLGASRDKETTGHSLITAVIKRDILDQYEGSLSEAGLRPGRIDIASFAVWNLYRDHLLSDSAGRGFTLMNMCCGKMTVMVFEGGVVRFYRLKDLGLDPDARQGPPDLSAIMRELRTSLTYYKEHVSGAQVDLVYVAGPAGDREDALKETGAGIGLEIRRLSLDNVMGAGGVIYRPVEGLLYGAACGAALER